MIKIWLMVKDDLNSLFPYFLQSKSLTIFNGVLPQKKNLKNTKQQPKWAKSWLWHRIRARAPAYQLWKTKKNTSPVINSYLNVNFVSGNPKFELTDRKNEQKKSKSQSFAVFHGNALQERWIWHLPVFAYDCAKFFTFSTINCTRLTVLLWFTSPIVIIIITGLVFFLVFQSW